MDTPTEINIPKLEDDEIALASRARQLLNSPVFQKVFSALVESATAEREFASLDDPEAVVRAVMKERVLFEIESDLQVLVDTGKLAAVAKDNRAFPAQILEAERKAHGL